MKYAARHLHHLNGIHIKNIVASNVVNRPIYKIGASHSFVKNVTKNSKARDRPLRRGGVDKARAGLVALHAQLRVEIQGIQNVVIDHRPIAIGQRSQAQQVGVEVQDVVIFVIEIPRLPELVKEPPGQGVPDTRRPLGDVLDERVITRSSDAEVRLHVLAADVTVGHYNVISSCACSASTCLCQYAIADLILKVEPHQPGQILAGD